MLTYSFFDEEQVKDECAFLLGGFDGLHLGHLQLVNKAKSLSLPVGALTIFGGKGESLFLKEERERVFSSLGVDFLITANFAEIKDLTAEEFLSLLLQKCSVSAFVCGKDFRFGRGAVGSPEFIGEQTKIPVFAMDISLDENGEKIGTRALKEWIKRGDVEKANALLVQKFCVAGEVVHGRGVARNLSFPTANLRYPENKMQLGDGVYAVLVQTTKGEFRGIAHFGNRPTFSEGRALEVHLDDFHGDLYGEKINLIFYRKLREVKKFSSPEELKKQLERDLRSMRSILTYDKIRTERQ